MTSVRGASAATHRHHPPGVQHTGDASPFSPHGLSTELSFDGDDSLPPLTPLLPEPGAAGEPSRPARRFDSDTAAALFVDADDGEELAPSVFGHLSVSILRASGLQPAAQRALADLQARGATTNEAKRLLSRLSRLAFGGDVCVVLIVIRVQSSRSISAA